MIKLRAPSSIQASEKFTAAVSNRDRSMNIRNKILPDLATGKNSTKSIYISAEKPAKSPRLFQEPKTLAVLPSRRPKDNHLGKNKYALWKISRSIDEKITPHKSMCACFSERTLSATRDISMKPANTNQKLPVSNITPKRDTGGLAESKAEAKDTSITTSPDNRSQDLGIRILPSTNLPIAHSTAQIASPRTKTRPLEISIGISVKGRQKTGNRATIRNNDKNASRSNMFELMG